MNGGAINGASGQTYSIASATTAQAGTYDVVATDACGTTVLSATATLTVTPITLITTEPQPVAVCAGSVANFSVTASGANLTYRWLKNGSIIAGATSAAYSIATASATDAANYSVIVSGTCGADTSVVVALTVNASPAITTQPASQTPCVGSSVTFSVTATGSGLGYQWRKNGAAISGATGNSYTISSVAAADAGPYDVVVSGTCSPSVTSTAAMLALPTINTWLGTVSTDWTNGANWCLGVPGVATDVTVNGSTPFAPTVNGAANVRNLTIANGATLTVSSTGILSVYGNVVNNGTLSAAGTLEMRGGAMQTLPAVTVGNLVVNGAGITCGGNLTVSSTLTLTAGNVNLGTYNLTFGNTAGGSAASHIITGGSGRAIAGNVGTAAVTVPVGFDAATYNPVTLANGGGRSFMVGVIVGITPSIFAADKAVNRTWSIVPSTALTTPVDLTLQFADADANTGVNATALMEVGANGGTGWVIVSDTGAQPTGTAAARRVTVSTTLLGNVVLTSPGGIAYVTAVPNINPTVTGLWLLPNPVRSRATLRINSLSANTIHFVLTDLNGREVRRFTATVATGTTDLPLALHGLPAGSYFLKGQSKKGVTETLRLVKMEE